MTDDETRRRVRNARVEIHGDGSLSIRDAVAYLPPDALKERVERALRERKRHVEPKE